MIFKIYYNNRNNTFTGITLIIMHCSSIFCPIYMALSEIELLTSESTFYHKPLRKSVKFDNCIYFHNVVRISVRLIHTFFKAGLKTTETELQQKIQEEENEKKAILQGTTIHTAAEQGDFERVKQLIEFIPEIKELVPLLTFKLQVGSARSGGFSTHNHCFD